MASSVHFEGLVSSMFWVRIPEGASSNSCKALNRFYSIGELDLIIQAFKCANLDVPLRAGTFLVLAHIDDDGLVKSLIFRAPPPHTGLKS